MIRDLKKEMRQDLHNHHAKMRDFVIVALNDYSGLKYAGDDLLSEIVKALSRSDLNPTVLNLFSAVFNKTKHIDYFLKHNPSYKEIKEINQPSISEGNNFFHLFKLMTNPIYEEDQDIRLADALKEADEPIVIYASGYSDDFVNLEEKMENNIKNLLSLNSKTKLLCLGSSFETEKAKYYNEILEKLSQKYGLNYINTKSLARRTNSRSKFYRALSDNIIIDLYFKKLNNSFHNYKNKELNYDNEGLSAIIEDIRLDGDSKKEEEIIEKVLTKRR